MHKTVEIATAEIGTKESPAGSNKVKYNTCETWKDVIGYEGLYMVSSRGKIICIGSKKSRLATVSKNGNLILKQQNNRGYLKVLLTNGDSRKTHTVHRLVAKAFILNEENKPTVNHINGIKTDNRVENLEWNTVSENISHAFNNLGKISYWKGRKGKHFHCSKKVKCIETGEIFDSIKEAAFKYSIHASNITNVLKGKIKTAGGKKWELL